MDERARQLLLEYVEERRNAYATAEADRGIRLAEQRKQRAQQKRATAWFRQHVRRVDEQREGMLQQQREAEARRGKRRRRRQLECWMHVGRPRWRRRWSVSGCVVSRCRMLR